jgi:LysM repeat protein
MPVVAQEYHLKIEDLCAWNHLEPDVHLYVGQMLKLEP